MSCHRDCLPYLRNAIIPVPSDGLAYDLPRQSSEFEESNSWWKKVGTILLSFITTERSTAMDTTIAPAPLPTPDTTYPAPVHAPRRTSDTPADVQSGSSLACNSRIMTPNGPDDLRLPWTTCQHQDTRSQWRPFPGASKNECRTGTTITHQPQEEPLSSINSGAGVIIIPRKIDSLSSYEANQALHSEPIEGPEAKPILTLGCNDWQEVESIISIGYHISTEDYVLEAEIRMYLEMKQQDLLLPDVVSLQNGPEAVSHYLGVTQPPDLGELLAILDRYRMSLGPSTTSVS